MKNSSGQDDERKEKVEGEKPCKCGVVDREAAPDPLNKGAADVWHCGEKVSNDGRTSEGHLASW